MVLVELQKLAGDSLVGCGNRSPSHTLLCLLVDPDICLHCLYGGFYTDLGSGQWNLMFSYLAILTKVCLVRSIEIVIVFKGMLEKAWLHEWVKQQGNECRTA